MNVKEELENITAALREHHERLKKLDGSQGSWWKRSIRPAKYTAVFGCIVASIYTMLDLVTPEHWVPTFQWMRDWSFLFILPLSFMIGVGAARMLDWLDDE